MGGDIVRGPAPGPGRSAYVCYNGMVWTNGESEDVAEVQVDMSSTAC